MGKINITCSCGRVFSVDGSRLGKPVQCSQCGSNFVATAKIEDIASLVDDECKRQETSENFAVFLSFVFIVLLIACVCWYERSYLAELYAENRAIVLATALTASAILVYYSRWFWQIYVAMTFLWLWIAYYFLFSVL